MTMSRLTDPRLAPPWRVSLVVGGTIGVLVWLAFLATGNGLVGLAAGAVAAAALAWAAYRFNRQARAARTVAELGVDDLPDSVDVLVVNGPTAYDWPTVHRRLSAGALILVNRTDLAEQRALADEWAAAGGLRVLKDGESFILLAVG